MAYQTGSATDVEDLMSDLFTFATGLSTTPWTQDELSTGANYGTMHRGNCYVSFRWDATTQEQIAIYQSLGFSGPSVDPHTHLDDSGNGSTTSPATTQRRIDLINSGAISAYHFFAGEGSTPYIHVVVEHSSGLFRHFGYGNLVKLNNWTGGEYCYGAVWSETDSTIDDPKSGFHAMGMDESFTSGAQATLHCEGLPNQHVDSKWAILASSTPGTDRGGDPRVLCRSGARGGLWGYYLGWMPTSQLNSYKPIIPIDVVYLDTGGTTDAWRWLGHQPDVGIVNMRQLDVGDTITVGSDDWMVFPWIRKQHSLNNTLESWNAGWAYKKT